MALGNPFTLADGVTDEEAWPARREARPGALRDEVKGRGARLVMAFLPDRHDLK